MARGRVQGVLQRARDLCRGVARKGGQPLASGGPVHSPKDVASRWSRRHYQSWLRSRPLVAHRVGAAALRALILVGACLLLVAPALAGAEERIRSIRVWPARDYTRVTIETDVPLRYTSTALRDPERLVLDLEEIDFLSATDQIANKVKGEDPYVMALRAGRFKPGTVRIVIDLKAEVRPQIFTLLPIADYGHRLVLDLYP